MPYKSYECCTAIFVSLNKLNKIFQLVTLLKTFFSRYVNIKKHVFRWNSKKVSKPKKKQVFQNFSLKKPKPVI